MKNTKHLNKILGIKHISKPTDLPKLNDMAEVEYNDPQYPYESSYVKLPPKEKKVSKKSLKKRVVQKRVVKPIVQKPIVQKKSLIKRIFSWLAK